MEEKIFIKEVLLSNGKKIQSKDYAFKDSFYEDVLEYISDDVIEYYAMHDLDLNTYEHHIKVADDDDLVDELKNRHFNFIYEADEDDMIEYLEAEGYIVLEEEESEVNRDLDYVDTIKLDEIIEMFTNASWSERNEILLRVKGGNL